ncbi:MAG: bifunctional tRNA (5-methylaminomethyl-2-thiouridine)(34)-methyltransferase MnmD/FAD-dependent 5-carboxymethylaminomethyl-2-thiouridine(34) oxidoreductase MnmC [Pseudomonadota bacterium]
MKGAPVSKHFDDVYFSADNGLAETHHVFIEGNALPTAWQGVERFVIGETGLGTGLNFLAAWKLFEETADQNAQLHFVSFEKFPLGADDIRQALMPFADELGDYIDRFLEAYPILIPGFHRVSVSDRVFLTLIFDDINEAIPQLDAAVDCWFLDGFTPAKNPEMWTDTVFENMARLSASGASFATFTAAGDVKRGLQAAGFEVQKADGYGRKRDMLIGAYKGEREPQKISKPNVAIIGGGLAGTSCAYALKRYGLSPVIYDRHQGLAQEASGNPAGLFNPRFSAFRTGESDFYASAFAQVLQNFDQFDDIDLNMVGALHVINSDEKTKRFHTMLENWIWPDDEMQIVDAEAASEIAGITIDKSALYLKRSGSVNPAKLCHAYAEGVEVVHKDIDSLNDIDADIIVLASGSAVKDFVPWLPTHAVRGQVTSIKESDLSENLKCNLHYGGYISAARDGEHMVGSTFQKWLSHTDVLDEDHTDNLDRLRENVSAFADADFEIRSGRAGLRTSSKDRFPIAGKVPNMENVYVSTAHASHGIVSSLASAQMIADQITGAPFSQSIKSQKSLSAQRFIDRAIRKGEVLDGYDGNLG